MGDDQSNPWPHDPGDETRAGCDIYGYPVRDPLAEMRDAYDESEPDHEVSSLLDRVDELEAALRSKSIITHLSASWHHLPCVTAGLADPRDAEIARLQTKLEELETWAERQIFMAKLRDGVEMGGEPDPRDAEITQLKADVVEAQRQASNWKAVNSISIHCLKAALGRLKELRGDHLSASWHHLPCITAGLADPRVSHPVVRAIRRGWRV